MEVIGICQRQNLAVPEQVVVVGGTGLHTDGHSVPSLSTLSQPMEEMGREAASMLLEMIVQGKRSIPGKLVPSVFEPRESFPIGQKTVRGPHE